MSGTLEHLRKSKNTCNSVTKVTLMVVKVTEIRDISLSLSLINKKYVLGNKMSGDKPSKGTNHGSGVDKVLLG